MSRDVIVASFSGFTYTDHVIATTMQFNDTLRTCLCVKFIDVLRHYTGYPLFTLQPGQRVVRHVWCNGGKSGPAHVVACPVAFTYRFIFDEVPMLNRLVIGSGVQSNTFRSVVRNAYNVNGKRLLGICSIGPHSRNDHSPDSVEIPAPVSTRMCGLSSRNFSRRCRSLSKAGSWAGTNIDFELNEARVPISHRGVCSRRILDECNNQSESKI